MDFAIWQLFSSHGSTYGRILHLLCQGFRRDASARDENAPSAIPGIASTYPNSHVTSMKAMPWPRVLALWGSEGERAMIDLLIDCAIFLPVPGTQGVYNQLSGEMEITPSWLVLTCERSTTWRTEGSSIASCSLFKNSVLFKCNSAQSFCYQLC